MEKEGRGIFRAGRGTQPGTANSETPPGKGTGSGEGTPRASRHSRSAPPPFLPPPLQGSLWAALEGRARDGASGGRELSLGRDLSHF